MDFLLGDQLPYGVNRSICSASEWKRRFGGGMSLLLHPARDAFIGGPLLGKRIKRMRTRLARLNGRNAQDLRNARTTRSGGPAGQNGNESLRGPHEAQTDAASVRDQTSSVRRGYRADSRFAVPRIPANGRWVLNNCW